MDKQDKAGTPIMGENAERTKLRAKGLAFVGDVASDVTAEGDGWAIALSEKKRALVADETDLPSVIHAMLLGAGAMFKSITHPMVMLDAMAAIHAGLQRFMEDVDKHKADRILEAFDLPDDASEEDIKKEVAASILKFLEGMEKRDEDSNSDVPD